MSRIPTYVYSEDPVVEAGVATQLRRSASVEVLGEDRLEVAQVAVVAVESPTDESLRAVRALHRHDGPAVVLVVAECSASQIVEAIAAGICGLIRRAEATPAKLASVVEAAAAGHGSLPPDLLGGLFGQVSRLRDGISGALGAAPNLDERELQVLRLVADGMDTKEIAVQLVYSERTIKSIIHEVTQRLGLRNRSHAVAYAVRNGLI